MVRPVLLDFECRSSADLKAVGGRRYWEHPDTRVLCCAWADTRDGSRGIWRPGDRWPFRGRVLSAHNANGFDRFGGIQCGFCGPEDRWVDTAEEARKAGLPGALDALGKRWLGIPKDKVAGKAVTRLSTAKKPKGYNLPRPWGKLPRATKRRLGVYPEYTEDDRRVVEAYNVSDVDIQVHGWPLLQEWLDVDADTQRVDRDINDRGVAFDSELAAALLRCDERNGEIVCERVADMLGWHPEEVREVANSPKQFVEETGAPNAQRATVEAMTHPLAVARLALASIARGKLTAGLARVSPDGRLRDTHRYYGAHTARWSGRGMQLQNMPRPSDRFKKWTDADIGRLALQVLHGRHASHDEVNLLLRATIRSAPGKVLIVRDFSGVEARANAYCAGDEAALRVFRSGADPYRVMASTVFGRPYDSIDEGSERTLGKIAELACGYGMGWRKFEETCVGWGIDLSAIGVSPKHVVDAWRELHPAIVKFWRDCERAFKRAAEGKPSFVSCFEFACTANDVIIYLPSGRPIVYPEVKFREGRYGVEATYLTTTRGRKGLYGGLIVENVIQAMCRDMLAEALVELERRGLDVVMHVHDEGVVECYEYERKDAEDEVHEVFTTRPRWAPNFPLEAKGFTGERYHK